MISLSGSDTYTIVVPVMHMYENRGGSVEFDFSMQLKPKSGQFKPDAGVKLYDTLKKPVKIMKKV